MLRRQLQKTICPCAVDCILPVAEKAGLAILAVFFQLSAFGESTRDEVSAVRVASREYVPCQALFFSYVNFGFSKLSGRLPLALRGRQSLRSNCRGVHPTDNFASGGGGQFDNPKQTKPK